MVGSESQMNDFNRNFELNRVQIRLEEKMEEYGTPQRDNTSMKGTPTEHSFNITVAALVHRVSK